MKFNEHHATNIANGQFALVGVFGLLGGVLLAFAYSNDPVWWTAWAAPAPSLAALLLAPQKCRRYVGLAIGILAGSMSFDYRVETGSLAAALIITAAYALGWSSTLRLTGAAANRWGAMVASLVLPTAWAAIDTIMNQFSPHGSLGSLAYSQAGMLPALQLASLGGVSSVTFLILLLGSVAGLVIAQTFSGIKFCHLARAIGLALIITFVAVMFGSMRLKTELQTSDQEIAMITIDRKSKTLSDWNQFDAIYGDALNKAASKGRIVLLPEAILRLDAAELQKTTTELTSLAKARKVTIVLGVVVHQDNVSTNRALVAMPDGSSFSYIKQHLVPGLESDLTAGNQNLVVNAPMLVMGLAICKDLHFPSLGREYAQDGARLMLVPANDFEVDDRLMMTVAAVRGIEGGFAVARAARSGMSSISDPYGRILAERRSSNTIGTIVVRAPNPLAEPPFYARFGDVFGWVCLIAWLGMWFGLRFNLAKVRKSAK